MNKCKQQEPFDYRQHQFLGKYIYVLIDPRDHFVFYVGQGLKERVGSHFDETRSVMSGKRKFNEKTRRIYDIWESGKQVDVAIARKRLRDSEEASHVEGALIQTLKLFGHPLTNKVHAPQTSKHGWSDIAEIRREAAPMINPSLPIDRVHLFKIENQVRKLEKNHGQSSDSKLLFFALQRSWYRGKKKPNGEYAVGYMGNPAVSVVVCKITDWVPCEKNEGKWAIVREEGDEEIHSELMEKNWTAVTKARGGAQNWPTPAQVEFDGHGTFRFLHGAKDKSKSHLLDK